MPTDQHTPRAEESPPTVQRTRFATGFEVLQIISDLHLEMHADYGAGFLRELDPTGIDILVLAGDITSARHFETLANTFRPLVQKYRHILYVPGNHEYYKTSPQQVAHNLSLLTKELPAVVVPNNEVVVIAGQRFIGGTMWCRPDPAEDLNKPFMSNFSLGAEGIESSA